MVVTQKEDAVVTWEVLIRNHAPEEELPALLVEARRGFHERDPGACLRLAEWACERTDSAAVPALCELLARPKKRLQRRQWRRPEWVQARLKAVEALNRIGGENAANVLALTLLYDQPEVREQAAAGLLALGDVALPPLVKLVREALDWPADGMQAVIETLGELKERDAGPCLARVLFSDLPLAPTRTTSRPMLQAVLLLPFEFSFLILLAEFRAASGPLETIGIAALSLLFLGVPAAMMNWFFLFMPYALVRHRRDRIRLSKSAAVALSRIQDKMALPSVIEVALGSKTDYSQRAAIQTLLDLFPLLETGDYGLFSNNTERHLANALGSDSDELVLAVVRALEFIGTGQSAGPVERLTRRRPPQNDALVFMEIRDTAERILPLLKERQMRKESATVLLRASYQPASASDQLLRPSMERGENQSEQLLRSTDSYPQM